MVLAETCVALGFAQGFWERWRKAVKRRSYNDSKHAHSADDYSIARITSTIKGPFAHRIIADWREHSPQKLPQLRTTINGRLTHRFWQAGGGFDRNLFGMRRIGKAIVYIEYNPVGRGLVKETTDWRWSSAQARAGYSNAVLAIDEITRDLVCFSART